MKTLYLIFSKLKAMICKDIFFFIMLFFGVLVCNLMFTYMYGVIIRLNERDDMYDLFVYYQGGERKPNEEIISCMNKRKATVDYYALLGEGTAFPDAVGESINLLDFSIQMRSDLSLLSTRTGNIKNLEQPNTVIAPVDIGLAMDDEITLNGAKLKVVGTSIIPSFIVSEATFMNNSFYIDMFAVDASKKDIGKIKKEAIIMLGEAYATETVEGAELDSGASSTLAVVALLYMLCMLAFLYLVASLYDDFAYEFNIYEIIGAKRSRVLVVFGGVMLVFLAVSSLAAQLIHALFYDVFFSKMNIFGEYTYTLGDYALLFSITLVAVYFFVFLYICLKARKSAIVNARKFIA